MSPLRIVSLNTWGLPLGLARDLPRRTEALASTFAESDADAIALQEVWTERARTRLREAGRAAGFEHAFFVDAPRGNAGLVVLSRHPFANGKASHFRVRGRAERIQHGDFWAAKGWLDVVLDTPAGRLRLVTTHLHAAYADGDRADEYAGERMGQAVELAHGLRDRSLPTVVVGDFNMHEGSEEYAVWRSLSGTDDVAARLDARAMTVESGHPYVSADTPDQRIDYGFVRDGHAMRARPASIERVYDTAIDLGRHAPGRYSDHAGLQIDVDLEAGPPRLAPVPALALARPEAIKVARARLEDAAATTEARAQNQTTIGLAGLLVSGGAGFASDLTTRNRRAVIRSLAFGLPGVAALASGLTVALGQGFTSSAARRFLDVVRLLRDFETD